MKELTKNDFNRAISGRLRRKIAAGKIDSGKEVIELRKFLNLTQLEFAEAMGISVYTLRNWEQGRRTPEGPAVALLRIAARHPRIILSYLKSAA